MAKDEKKESSPEPLTRIEQDVALIRRAFHKNDKLLLAMRAVMLGLGADDTEKKMVRDAFANTDLLVAVSQRFLPKIRKDDAIGNLSEVWKGVEKMIFGYGKETIEQALLYKQQGIAMVQQALDLLTNPDGPAPSLDVVIDIKNDPLGIQLLTRNQFVSAIEDQLVGLRIVASKEEMSADEKKKAAEKDSLE